MRLLSTRLPLLLLRGQYKNSWNRFRSTALENRDAKAQPPEGTHDWLSQFEVAAKDSNRYSGRDLPNDPRSNRPRCLRIGQHEYNIRITTIPSNPRCPSLIEIFVERLVLNDTDVLTYEHYEDFLPRMTLPPTVSISYERISVATGEKREGWGYAGHNLSILELDMIWRRCQRKGVDLFALIEGFWCLAVFNEA